jgi:hypothetical protein
VVVEVPKQTELLLSVVLVVVETVAVQELLELLTQVEAVVVLETTLLLVMVAQVLRFFATQTHSQLHSVQVSLAQQKQ